MTLILYACPGVPVPNIYCRLTRLNVGYRSRWQWHVKTLNTRDGSRRQWYVKALNARNRSGRQRHIQTLSGDANCCTKYQDTESHFHELIPPGFALGLFSILGHKSTGVTEKIDIF